jgi:hypothetical protein
MKRIALSTPQAATRFMIVLFGIIACSGDRIRDRGEPTAEQRAAVSASTPLLGVGELPVRIPLGGMGVAVELNPASPTTTAIVASETGGLFRSTDGFFTWSHLDGMPAIRMRAVKYASSDGLRVIATANQDLRSNNGIWYSLDGGTSWTHAALSLSCTPTATAWGIAWSSPNIYVATDCGVARSSDAVNWTLTSIPSTTRSVLARGQIVDACSADGVRRSTNAGVSFGTVSPISTQAPGCYGSHTIDGPPDATNVVLVSVVGSDVGGNPVRSIYESRNAAATWTEVAHFVGGYSKPPWLRVAPRTAPPSLAFDVWFGDGVALTWQNCNTPAGTPSYCRYGDGLPGGSWIGVSISHADVNHLAMQQGCPKLMVSDGGIYGSQDCGSNWSPTGAVNPDNGWHGGYNALQVYDIAGQIHPTSPNARTDLYIGTQDNNVWTSRDDGYTWAGMAPEGFNCSMARCTESSCRTWVSNSIIDRPMIGTIAGGIGNFVSNAYMASGVSWTEPPNSDTNPGGRTYPIWLRIPGNPAQDLFGEFARNAPTDPTYLRVKSIGAALSQTWQGGTGIQGPALPLVANAGEYLLPYRPVIAEETNGTYVFTTTGRSDSTSGLVYVNTGTGTSGTGSASGRADIGLGSIGRWCNQFVCASSYGVDPKNSSRLMVADIPPNNPAAGVMKSSIDRGTTWQTDTSLTNLLTNSGQFPLGANGFVQPRVIAYDPDNGNRILVGTESAGIMMTSDAGAHWSKIAGSEKVTNVTGIFFDEFRQTITMSTYGRGLWSIVLPVTFDVNTVQRSNRVGDWQPWAVKAECADNEYLVGVSKEMSAKRSHGALCRPGNINRFAHNSCVARNFSAGDSRGTVSTGDWDPGYYKGECAAHQYVAGVSQSSSGDITSILCCTGFAPSLAHSSCSKVVFQSTNGQEDASNGDWDPWFWKGDCGTGRYVAGMSRDLGSQPGAAHALLCCTP